MLYQAKNLNGFTLGAVDGEIGRVKDFYFEDENWAVRYLVADTGKWLPLRRVLISPFAVQGFGEPERIVRINLTRDQIKGAPSIDEDAPVSRQYELEYYKYYGWPYYWQGSALWGPLARPIYGPAGLPPYAPAAPPEPRGDPHLHGTDEVTGYYLEASDGEIGHIDDFIIDDEDWVIQYLVADTRNWWPGKKVLISTAWATSVDWDRSQVHVNLERAKIQEAPEYDSSIPIRREFEARLFEHYNRAPYWERRLAA